MMFLNARELDIMSIQRHNSQQQRNTSKNFKTFVSMLPTDLQSTTGKQKK